MQHIVPFDRHQVSFSSLEELIAQDDPVRFLDAVSEQEINEHIFGTIKRKWGYYYTNLIGLEKVNGEWSFIMLNYNIKRVLNIFTLDDLMLTLKNWKPKYRKEWLLAFITMHFNRIIRFNYIQTNLAA